MKKFDQPHEMREWSRLQNASHFSIGFVPTMGALHDGHKRLIEVAQQDCDRVIVSIFVNALQFNNSQDYEKYPRLMDADIQICKEIGVDALYAPSHATMYPPGFETHITPGATAAPMEGAFREGHFAGVATVVNKLLNATLPDRAYFGAKDFQQLAVIKRMVIDFDINVAVIPVATVRQPDGLALSSRNTRLTAQQRDAACVIYRGLEAARAAYLQGAQSSAKLISITKAIYASCPEARLEYVEIFDSTTMCTLQNISKRNAVMAVAVWFGDIRLIDNIEFTA